jgi:hypothetical protein
MYNPSYKWIIVEHDFKCSACWGSESVWKAYNMEAELNKECSSSRGCRIFWRRVEHRMNLFMPKEAERCRLPFTSGEQVTDIYTTK